MHKEKFEEIKKRQTIIGTTFSAVGVILFILKNLNLLYTEALPLIGLTLLLTGVSLGIFTLNYTHLHKV